MRSNSSLMKKSKTGLSLLQHIAKLSKETQEIPSLLSATEELQEGIKMLHTHQKLVRLADRSDLGWAVVNAYESDELASDDEDAKRMKEAKKDADQKDPLREVVGPQEVDGEDSLRSM